MLRSRICRQGAHQVNSRSSSGWNLRGRSVRPCPMIFSSIACSAGVCPICSGLRSFGCTSRGSRATFRSPHNTIRVPAACSAAA